MSALSADKERKLKGARSYSFKIKDATQLYVGSYASLLSGYLQPFAGAAGELLVGRVLPTPNPLLTAQLLGNTSPPNPSPVPEAVVNLEDEILIQVSVTGVAAITDIGDIVYLNSTDNDLTITRPTRGQPMGVVVRWWSSTTCDVLVWNWSARSAISLGGDGADLKMLMSFQPVSLGTGVTGLVLCGQKIPYRYRVISLNAQVDKALAGGTSIVITAQKGASAFTTGGVITLSTAGGSGGTAGDQVAATAITQDATTIFSESDVLNLSFTSTGTFTGDGSVCIYANLARQLGI